MVLPDGCFSLHPGFLIVVSAANPNPVMPRVAPAPARMRDPVRLIVRDIIRLIVRDEIRDHTEAESAEIVVSAEIVEPAIVPATAIVVSVTATAHAVSHVAAIARACRHTVRRDARRKNGADDCDGCKYSHGHAFQVMPSASLPTGSL